MVDMAEAAAVSISPELAAALAKVAVFALVQALVYLILRKSSGIFSPDRTAVARSLSFRPMRSMSVRRFLAALSDVPVGVMEDGGSSAPAPAHRGPADLAEY